MKRCLLFVKKNIIVGIVIFNLSFFASFNILAEEKEAIETYYPVDIQKRIPASAIEPEINAMKQSIKGFDYFSLFFAYKAVKENNLTVCNNSAERSKCISKAEALFDILALAEGNCSSIKREVFRKFDLCEALKMGNCDSLVGWKRDMCQAFLKEDFVLLEQVKNSQDFKEFLRLNKAKRWEKEDLLTVFAYFFGIKYFRSKMACEKYGQQLPLPKKLICEVIFSTNDVDEILDKIALDIALFTVAKKYNNLKYCDRIKDSDIKERCRDKAITKIW